LRCSVRNRYPKDGEQQSIEKSHRDVHILIFFGCRAYHGAYLCLRKTPLVARQKRLQNATLETRFAGPNIPPKALVTFIVDTICWGLRDSLGGNSSQRPFALQIQPGHASPLPVLTLDREGELRPFFFSTLHFFPRAQFNLHVSQHTAAFRPLKGWNERETPAQKPYREGAHAHRLCLNQIPRRMQPNLQC